ncbi:MAG: hypothetical protein JWL90_1229 [Chthoniobacteraceae bacterium]|nr:hypothetical protein [Chthoniobacteraceae bacterium]
MKRGFTLIELLVVIAITAVLAALASAGFSRVMEGSRSTACFSNLRQLGAGLGSYLADHNMTMPVMHAGRRSKSEDIPVPDNVLNAYIKDPALFRCPADKGGIAAATGTSYNWNVALNGQSLASLSFLNLADQQSRIPVLADKEGFHLHEDKKVNILYADGHATRNLNFLP